MTVQSLCLGTVMTNVYFLMNEDTKEMLIVDPAVNTKRICAQVDVMQGKPVAVLLTHGHFDHIMATKDIAEKYNVSQEAIMEYNNLASPRLTKRQVLLIPTWLSGERSRSDNENMPADEKSTGLLFPTDTADSAPGEVSGREAANDEVMQPEKREPERLFGRRDVEIALILPLTSASRTGYNSQYMDFYTGALLAASDFKESGVTVTLNVYDQGRYNTMEEIFNSEGFGRNQLVIGPVMAEEMKEALPLAESLGIPIVSPMDQTAEKYIAGNICFIQAPAGGERQTENSVALLEKYCGDPRNHMMLIYQKGYEASNAVTEAKRFLEAENAEYSTLSYNSGRQNHKYKDDADDGYCKKACRLCSLQQRGLCKRRGKESAPVPQHGTRHNPDRTVKMEEF